MTSFFIYCIHYCLYLFTLTIKIYAPCGPLIANINVLILIRILISFHTKLTVSSSNISLKKNGKFSVMYFSVAMSFSLDSVSAHISSFSCGPKSSLLTLAFTLIFLSISAFVDFKFSELQTKKSGYCTNMTSSQCRFYNR